MVQKMNYMFISSLKHSLHIHSVLLAMTHEWDFPHNQINVPEHNWSTVCRPQCYQAFSGSVKSRTEVNQPPTYL